MANSCVDCGGPLRLAGSTRCKTCVGRWVGKNRRPRRIKQPDREKVRREADRLPGVLEDFIAELEP